MIKFIKLILLLCSIILLLELFIKSYLSVLEEMFSFPKLILILFFKYHLRIYNHFLIIMVIINIYVIKIIIIKSIITAFDFIFDGITIFKSIYNNYCYY